MKWWDKSWNPATGCVPCSAGCDNCISLLNLSKQGRSLDPQFNQTAFSKDLMKGLNYIVCSLGDLFDLKDWNHVDMIFDKMIKNNDSRFFVCTKKPALLKSYMDDAEWESDQLDNIWFGTSVESQEHCDRVQDLIDTVEIYHRYVQVEPMLGPVSLKEYFETGEIDWLIIGSETGECRRPTNLEWIENLIAEAKAYGVKVFVNWFDSDGNITDDINVFPQSIRFRETPWSNFSSAERKDLLNGRVTEFKLQDGNIEIRCPVSIYWKLKAMIKNISCFGYIFRGKEVPKSKEIEESINSALDIFHNIKNGDDSTRAIAWDFLPKELVCRSILTEQMVQKISIANDREISEIFRTTIKMFE